MKKISETNKNQLAERRKLSSSAGLLCEGSRSKSDRKQGDVYMVMNRNITEYSKFEIWTPAMGALLICGIKAPDHCSEIPHGGMGLDDSVLHASDRRFDNARLIFKELVYGIEENDPLLRGISPLEFFVWCDQENIRTDWLDLFVKIAGCADPTAIGLTPFNSALACASFAKAQFNMEHLLFLQNIFADFQATENSHPPPIHPALQAFDTLPDSAFVSLPVVCGLYECSAATAWRRVKSGQIVSPHRIGARTTRWNVGELRRALSVGANPLLPC